MFSNLITSVQEHGRLCTPHISPAALLQSLQHTAQFLQASEDPRHREEARKTPGLSQVQPGNQRSCEQQLYKPVCWRRRPLQLITSSGLLRHVHRNANSVRLPSSMWNLCPRTGILFSSEHANLSSSTPLPIQWLSRLPTNPSFTTSHLRFLAPWPPHP